MRIFVTGATGFVGSAVVQELIRAGHEVVGLVRSESSATSLAATGAKIHRGDLTDLESLRAGADESDGVIHTGFIHDFSRFKENCEIDRKAIQSIGSVLAGSKRPFVITSAIGILPPDEIATEDTMPLSPSPNPRAATEEAARETIGRGVNVSIVRLPPSTHGKGDHGFVPTLIRIAREKGISVFAGEGQNTWPAGHRLDAAQVFLRAFEMGVPNSYYHAVAEEGVAFREIAEAIGEGLNGPVASKTPQEASAHFGFFAHFAGMNVKASSQKTKAQLGWSPSHPGLISDLEQNYFAV
jgi:nucleoside-diphosphate-sugar epimerase